MLVKLAKQAMKRWLLARGVEVRIVRPEAIRNRPDAELLPSLDLVLARAMLDSPDFTFVQIGASDGVRSDPIHQYVTKYHWRGVLVEPQRDVFQSLCANYSAETQLRFENVAISAREGSQLFYTVDCTRPGIGASAHQLGSFNRDVVVSHGRDIPGLADALVTEEVPCMTFSGLLAKHGLQRLDLLQIDTEGYDYEIIKTIDFGRIKPRIIHYEHVHLKPADREACITLLVDQGYKVAVLGSFDTLAYLPASLT